MLKAGGKTNTVTKQDGHVWLLRTGWLVSLTPSTQLVLPNYCTGLLVTYAQAVTDEGTFWPPQRSTAIPTSIK